MPAAIAIGLAAMVCVGAAAYLAVLGKDGWGWFLFVAVLIASCINGKVG